MTTHAITTKNVNTAFVEALWWLRTAGVREPSRNGPVLVAPGPVITEYQRPLERVLFSPARDANPVFHLMEALWMLADEDKLSWLSQFNARMEAYGENGIQWGAYGHRWRSYFGKDQLTLVIAELRKNPDSRRAVIGMWDPCLDLSHEGPDIPCFSGDTTIKSPEGEETMKELAERFERGEITRWPVYSYNTETMQYRLSWCTRVWKTGHKKTLKINFLDGTSLRCTPDHVLYFRSGGNTSVISPIQAGKLRPGWKVLSHPFWASRDWEVLHRGVGDKNYDPIHELYADMLGWEREGMVIHHKDNNPRNNRADNLEVISHAEHATEHLAGIPSRDKKKRIVHHDEPRNFNGKSHVITSIEEGGEEDVYDFTVPGDHTALVNSGVVAHNCNTHIYFDLRGGALNMTVCCRSNDLLWGAYGANAVHFSVLQEVIAWELAVSVGVYRQMSNNFHIYTELPMVQKFLACPPYNAFDYYSYPPTATQVRTEPILREDETLLGLTKDCRTLVDGGHEFNTTFVARVAAPLRDMYLARKAGAPYKCPEGPIDWFVAFREWDERRKA